MNMPVHAFLPSMEAAIAGLLAGCWQGLLLTVGLELGLRLLPGLNAARRSGLWMAVFLLVVLLHVWPLASHQPMAEQAGLLRVDPFWCLAIAGVWASLSLCRAAQLVGDALRLRSISEQARPVACEPAYSALLRTARRPALLYTSRAVDRPSVIGFHSPRILLPPALLAGLSSAELNQILLHELEHLRRWDDWTNLLQKLALVVFPLDPALLWLERRLCAERELACDDGVLQVTRARKAYAACLARLAEHSMHSAVRRGASLVLAAWGRQTELSQRVYRVLRQPEQTFARRQASLVTGLLALASLAAGAGLARSPQLVRFAPANLRGAQATMTPSGSLAPRHSDPAARLKLAAAVVPNPRPRAIMPTLHAESVSLSRVAARRPRASSRLAKHQARLLARPLPLAIAYRVLPATPPAPWLLLAGWQQQAGPGFSRLVTDDETQATYAAVPVANGWLILQL